MGEEQDGLRELEELRQAANELEAKRDVMGDAVVDAALAAIQAQIASLENDAPAGATGDDIDVGDIKGAVGIAVGREARSEIQADTINIYQQETSGEDGPLRAFLHTVARRSGRLPLGPLDPAGQESAYLTLAQVFVGLDAGHGRDNLPNRSRIYPLKIHGRSGAYPRQPAT